MLERRICRCLFFPLNTGNLDGLSEEKKIQLLLSTMRIDSNLYFPFTHTYLPTY